jgi:hypothetical protein
VDTMSMAGMAIDYKCDDEKKNSWVGVNSWYHYIAEDSRIPKMPFINPLQALDHPQTQKNYQSVQFSSYRIVLPSARLTLHFTKLCTKFKIFRKKIFFNTKVTSEAFLCISQNLKVTRLQGCLQTKLWTCWPNFDLMIWSFERFLGLVHGFDVLQ